MRSPGKKDGLKELLKESLKVVRRESKKVERKIKKGLTLERIAEDLECSQEEIATIIPHNISPTARIT